MKHPLLTLTLASTLLSTASGEEWGAFRGPNGDGTIAAPASVRDWGRVKMKTLWKEETPAGFSSFAVAEGKAFTIITGENDGNPGEVLVCRDAKTGKQLWEAPLTIIAKYDGGGDSGTPENKGGDHRQAKSDPGDQSDQGKRELTAHQQNDAGKKGNADGSKEKVGAWVIHDYRPTERSQRATSPKKNQ